LGVLPARASREQIMGANARRPIMQATKQAAKQATIFHNPRCSKSRATLGLLEEHGVSPTVVEYLKTPPSAAQLRSLLDKLGLAARDLIRTGEPEWKASGKTLDAPERELVELMATHPILIERPIVVVGDRARIGRPPERVLELFE
jgi:arsenate reductase